MQADSLPAEPQGIAIPSIISRSTYLRPATKKVYTKSIITQEISTLPILDQMQFFSIFLYQNSVLPEEEFRVQEEKQVLTGTTSKY